MGETYCEGNTLSAVPLQELSKALGDMVKGYEITPLLHQAGVPELRDEKNHEGAAYLRYLG